MRWSLKMHLVPQSVTEKMSHSDHQGHDTLSPIAFPFNLKYFKACSPHHKVVGQPFMKI